MFSNHTDTKIDVQAMVDKFQHRIADLPLAEDMRQFLLQVVGLDYVALSKHRAITTITPLIQHGLMCTNDSIDVFFSSWLLMYASTRRLDHLQDNDPSDKLPLVVPTIGGQYNIVFGIYILAKSILDDIATVDASRVLRLHRLWNDCLIRMAVGQQQDLMFGDNNEKKPSFEEYQNIVLNKAGAMFALIFGGIATLLVDDQDIVNALVVLGEIYGTIIQYSDDVFDASSQSTSIVTLPQVLRQLNMTSISADKAPSAFWSYLYPIYRDAANLALTNTPVHLQEAMRNLFAYVFETP